MDENWWRDFFNEDYGRHYLARASALEVDFLLQHLQLPPAGRVFDQCSGVGRVSAALTRLGYRCLGVEQSLDYVQVACRSGLEVVHGDGRTFVTPQLCDGAINFFSSFGFFQSDRENFLFLQCAARSLVRGGRFILDCSNTLHILDHFQPVLVQRLPDGQAIRRRSELFWQEGMIAQHWQFFDVNGGLRWQKKSRLRLYMPQQLEQMLKAAGFQPLQLYGGYDQRVFDSSAPRLIWVSQRL